MKLLEASLLSALLLGLAGATPVERSVFGRSVASACEGTEGSGMCRSVSNNGCSGGTFHPGKGSEKLCPGDDDIQCCIEDGDDKDNEMKKRAATEGAGTANDATVKMLKGLEGFRANFYDINGHKTIGYGHDCVAKGDCGSISAPISKATGTKIFKKDLHEYENCVCKMKNAKDMNENQFGALVSFAYNSGCGGVQQYWHGAMEKKNFKGICEALPTTNTLNGQLTSRRKKESNLCSTSTSKKSGC